MVKNYTSLPPPADDLVSRWGSSTSSHWRSSQLFWLLVHKHTDRYGVERCRVCFLLCPNSHFFAACREIGGMSSGSGLVVLEQPHPFCSAAVDISKAAAGQCFVWFFWTSFAVLRTWIGKFWFFFFQWGNTPPHQCCVFYSSFRLLLPFLAPGSAFCTCYQAFVPWPVLESRC